MEEILIQNARAYASRHQLQLAERLGFGIHGIIHVPRGNTKHANDAPSVSALGRGIEGEVKS